MNTGVLGGVAVRVSQVLICRKKAWVIFKYFWLLSQDSCKAIGVHVPTSVDLEARMMNHENHEL